MVDARLDRAGAEPQRRPPRGSLRGPTISVTVGLSIGDYLARLVQDDASESRRGAAPFLADHQAVFDEAEQAARGPERRAPREQEN
jgi:hypothetical protein